MAKRKIKSVLTYFLLIPVLLDGSDLSEELQ